MKIIVDLYKLLNLGTKSSKDEIDRAYFSMQLIRSATDEVRIAWKILRDKNFRAVYDRSKNVDEVFEAGFFDDTVDEDKNWLNEDIRFICTPFFKIKNRLDNVSLNKKQKLAVLITTGSFSPIHVGHLAMMESAKKILEKKNYFVAGGYVVPAHDSYVANKKSGIAGMSASLRNFLAQMATSTSDWIMVDESESVVNPKDRNFTDIVNRLQKYVRFHFKDFQFDFFYVVGSDAASFVKAFMGIENSGAICVFREDFNGHKILSENIFYVESNDFFNKSSSTKIRNGELEYLPESILDTYKTWQESFNKISEYIPENNYYYHLRIEDFEFYKKWFNDIKKEKLLFSLNTFHKKLFKILQKSGQNTIPPAPIQRLKISPLYLEFQKKKLKEELANNENQTISLDVCVGGDYNVGVSRLFGLSDGQVRGAKLITRPENKDFRKILKDIPMGDYVLIEDDIGSGQTMNSIKEALPKGVNLSKIILLNKYNIDQHDRREYDVVDLRDFIVGAPYGGLVTQIEEKITRSVYAYPYVNLQTRAKIPFSNVLETSLSIWELNLEFFQNTGGNATLENMSETSVDVFLKTGFKKNNKVIDLCKWHIKKIADIIENNKLDYNIEFYHTYDDVGITKDSQDSISILLNTLEKITLQKDSYVLSVLIDDYRSKNFKLDKTQRNKIHQKLIRELYKEWNVYNINVDFFAFESMMVKIAKRLIKKIPNNLIFKEYSRSKGKYLNMLKNQGFIINLTESINGDVKYSCALLSACWSLCRLGKMKIGSDRLVSTRGKNFVAKKLITILPKDYEVSENKAKFILLKAGYKDALDNIEYYYY